MNRGEIGIGRVNRYNEINIWNIVRNTNENISQVFYHWAIQASIHGSSSRLPHSSPNTVLALKETHNKYKFTLHDIYKQ